MLLPIHPQPYPEELLTSWMVRLALENGWHLHSFYKVTLGYQKTIWNRDTDKYNHPDLFDCLSVATGVSKEKIQQLSLQSYNGILFHGNLKAANLRWILPLGIYHRRRKLLGLQYCPLCLNEQPVGYYRKYWRFAFYTMCHKHNVHLLNECPQCHSPIEFHRIGIGHKTEKIPKTDIALCHACEFNLRFSPASNVVSTRSSDFYREILNQFVNNYEQPLEGLAMPLVFYERLRYLVKMLLHPYSKKFRSYYINRFLDIPDLKIESRVYYECLSIEQRFYIGKMAAWLISDWPTKFIEMSQRKLLFRSAISDDLCRGHLPYWLGKEIRTHFSDQAYMPSDREVESAILYLKRSNIPVNASSIGKIMGISRDAAANRLFTLSPKQPPN